MSRVIRCLAMVATVGLLTACAAASGKMSAKDQALYDYKGAIRWSQFDQAWQFVNPTVREAHPLSDLERNRFKQVEVSQYEVIDSVYAPDGSLQQTVEIHLIGRNTQVERVIIDHQLWRWDEAKTHFWLESGLPDISAP